MAVKRVLVACECSGRVREAFRKLGHLAFSCDTEPSEDNSPQHIQADCRTVADSSWDLLIAHPPCRYLAVSGARWWKDRQALQQEAVAFVKWLANLPIAQIAIENPVGILSRLWRKPDQIIQPWQFGDPESKKTCLWLKNLPKLIATNILPLPECGYWQNQTPSGQNKLGPSPSRAKERARTYLGIADAMASQWGAA